MTAKVSNLPASATVLIEHVHVDMFLKSTNPQLDDLLQDFMDDFYHGYSQDGFFINNNYSYQNKFTVKGISKIRDLLGHYTYGTSHSVVEKQLIEIGKVYANKMQVSYHVLVKYADEDFYHVVSVLDEFLIPVK